MCGELEYVPDVVFEESYDTPIEGLGVSRSFFLLPKETYASPRPVSELTNREIGTLGEDFAARFLVDQATRSSSATGAAGGESPISSPRAPTDL